MEETIEIGRLCPYCKLDINLTTHNYQECLHESFTMITNANAKLEELENRINNPNEIHREGNRRILSFREKISNFSYTLFEIMRPIRDVAIVFALLRFIQYGLGI